MIIRGGENVYPKEIEEFLTGKMEGVLDVQVVGVKDQKFGEEIVAALKVSDLRNNRVTGDHVLRLCKGHIAHYKIPKYVVFLTEYPLTVSGKVQKFILKNQFEDMKEKGEL